MAIGDVVDAYIETCKRLEPDIAMVDPGALYASAAISLRRIADQLEITNSQLSGIQTLLTILVQR